MNCITTYGKKLNPNNEKSSYHCVTAFLLFLTSFYFAEKPAMPKAAGPPCVVITPAA